MEHIRKHRLWKNLNVWDRVFEDRLRGLTTLQHLQDGVGLRNQNTPVAKGKGAPRFMMLRTYPETPNFTYVLSCSLEN